MCGQQRETRLNRRRLGYVGVIHQEQVDCHVDNKVVYTYDKEEDGDETIPWEPVENRSAITENEEVTIREVSEAD